MPKYELVKTLVFETEADSLYFADVVFRQLETDNRFAVNITREIYEVEA